MTVEFDAVEAVVGAPFVVPEYIGMAEVYVTYIEYSAVT